MDGLNQSVSPASQISSGNPAQKTLFKRLVKEKTFARKYIEHEGNGQAAALALRPDLKPTSAKVLASILLRSPNVIAEIWRIADAQNADIGSVFSALGGGMQATKPLQDNTGAVVAEAPDHPTRIKAAIEAAKLLRLYPGGSDGSQGHGSRHLHLHLDDQAGPDVLEGLADRQARRQRKQPKAPTDLTVDIEAVSSEQTAKVEVE